MKLYAIRDKETGLFYDNDGRWWYNADGKLYGQVRWQTEPNFRKTIDGIKGCLKRIGCDRMKKPKRGENEQYSDWTARMKSKFYYYRDGCCYDNFDISRLKNLEVIVYDVSINGQHSIGAVGLFKAKVLK